MNATRNKFGAKREIVDGISFASRAEARRYRELCLLQKAGQIHELELQPKLDLIAGLKYTPDFCYRRGSEFIYEEIKGVVTADFTMRLALFHYVYPSATLLINGVDSNVKKPRKRRKKT
jgi:hypothetical protein